MPALNEHSPGDDFFNDLSQQPSNRSEEERRGSQDENGQAPKTKRIACVLCRKRKLKCDGQRPSCATCVRLQHECSYDEVRRKSGPKRGYVKALEARLAQVETLLKTQDEAPSGTQGKKRRADGRVNDGTDEGAHMGQARPHLPQSSSENDFTATQGHSMGGPTFNLAGDTNNLAAEPFPWEMIGLGLEEPLPGQDVIDELNEIYFEKIHPSLPMIHRPRFYAAMHLAPHMRPPVCLRYAMWCSAAAVSDKYEGLHEHFYARARRYIQSDELKGHGESTITIAHCQTWVLLAGYEFKLMYFPRAWLSSGRASRLALMMGLHRLDGGGLNVKQCVPPARDWIEREERRRTFWMAFCVDRYASIGTGWPMVFEEKDIRTALPADEESYDLNRPSKTAMLPQALDPTGPVLLSSFAGVVVLSCLFGRNLLHLHRPNPDDQDDDLNGEFWKRHRMLDNILLNTSLSLPDHLRLPAGINNPNIVFMNMNIHTSTICLHQAAIFKADKNRMPARISAESKIRCITAAAETTNIMRQISHLDVSAMNPFISFCLYVAARVFVQYLKSRPKDTQIRGSLQFLLTAMKAIQRKNPLTESFLVQLDVDLEAAGLGDAQSFRAPVPMTESRAQNGSCTASPEQAAPSSSALPSKRIPTYGDNGLATFTNPVPDTMAPKPSTFPPSTDTTPDDPMSYFHTAAPMELPSRQRSHTSKRSQESSQNAGFDHDMDTSPDISGGGSDHRTPPPSGSSRTSNTSHSPHNAQQYNPQLTTDVQSSSLFAMYDASDQFADFDLTGFPTTIAGGNPQSVGPPQHWSSAGPSGVTPGATAGFVSGLTAELMSDADWHQVMETFEWDPNLMAHDASMQDTTSRRP